MPDRKILNCDKGELEPILAGTTIACKNHGSEYLEDAEAVILIMRNPYDSFKVRVKLISSELKKRKVK